MQENHYKKHELHKNLKKERKKLRIPLTKGIEYTKVGAEGRQNGLFSQKK
jgi:hypothetical protein